MRNYTFIYADYEYKKIQGIKVALSRGCHRSMKIK